MRFQKTMERPYQQAVSGIDAFEQHGLDAGRGLVPIMKLETLGSECLLAHTQGGDSGFLNPVLLLQINKGRCQR